MPESQQDIDALLAEVNALADEAVASVADDESAASEPAAEAATPAAPPSPSAPAPTSAPPSPAPRGAAGRPEDVSRILNIEVPVIVQLAQRTMPLSKILSLSTGAIIEFDKPVDTELDLMINNKQVGRGQAVKVGENFGLRLTATGSVRARIQALAGQ